MSRVTPSDCHTTKAGYMCRFIDLFGMLEARSGSTLRGDQCGGPPVLCAQDGVYLTNPYYAVPTCTCITDIEIGRIV